MRMAAVILLLSALLTGGCARKHEAGLSPTAPGGAGAAGKPPADNRLIVTPEDTVVGKVARVNTSGRFVVVSFPVGRLPEPERIFSVYRRGLKVGKLSCR